MGKFIVIEGTDCSGKETQSKMLIERFADFGVKDIILGKKLDSSKLEIVKEKAEQRINVLEQYLRDTDWYAIRFADTEEPIPDEIKKRRQDARDEISKLRDIPVSKPEEEPQEVFFDYQIDSE